MAIARIEPFGVRCGVQLRGHRPHHTNRPNPMTVLEICQKYFSSLRTFAVTGRGRERLSIGGRESPSPQIRSGTPPNRRPSGRRKSEKTLENFAVLIAGPIQTSVVGGSQLALSGAHS